MPVSKVAIVLTRYHLQKILQIKTEVCILKIVQLEEIRTLRNLFFDVDELIIFYFILFFWGGGGSGTEK